MEEANKSKKDGKGLLNPNKRYQDPVQPGNPPRLVGGKNYGGRDAGAVMQTGKTNHGKLNNPANPGYNKPQANKGPGASGANGGWKPLPQPSVNKGGAGKPGSSANGVG